MLWRSLDATKVSDYDEFLKQEPENVRSLQSLRFGDFRATSLMVK